MLKYFRTEITHIGVSRHVGFKQELAFYGWRMTMFNEDALTKFLEISIYLKQLIEWIDNSITWSHWAAMELQALNTIQCDEDTQKDYISHIIFLWNHNCLKNVQYLLKCLM